MRKIILTTLLLVLPLVCFGQDEKQPLQLTIKSDKQVYMFGEPIWVTCRITNISDAPVKIVKYCSSEYSYETEPPSTTIRHKDYFAGAGGGSWDEDMKYTTIMPGQFQEWRNDLTSDSCMIGETGRIHVRRQTTCTSRFDQNAFAGHLTSNTITIEVVKKKENVKPASSVNPYDWEPFYVPGMEYGPSEKEYAIAMGKAEGFMAQQPFAGQYAKRACAVSEHELNIFEVSFSLLSDKTGRTRGIVQVNMKDGKCSWLEEKEISKN